MNEPQSQDRTNARGTGIWMLLGVLGGALLTFIFGMSSQTGFRDEQAWSLGAALFSVLVTLWLLLAGLALVRRAPGAKLRFPGMVATGAGIVGIVMFVPKAFGNSRASETVTFARILLPVAFVALSAGLGHLRRARGPSPVALALHWLAVVGIAVAMFVFILAVRRVV